MFIVLLSCLVTSTTSTYVDIHLPVVGTAYDQVVKANKLLNTQLGNSEVNFESTDIPHITLYLTSFTCPTNTNTNDICVDKIKDAIDTIEYGLAFQICNVTLSQPFAAGTYLMLNVSLTSCLQHYSDTVVNTTYKLSQPNQTAPSWVHSLPEPERSEKMHDITEYGSPNVFNQFQPHVTIAWSNDTSAIKKAAASLEFKSITFTSNFLGLGSVGNHGTVLRDEDYALYNLTARGNACRETYKIQKSCDADNRTDGGCVWCDIVDHPPFCTSYYHARQFLPPPQGQPFQCNF